MRLQLSIMKRKVPVKRGNTKKGRFEEIVKEVRTLCNISKNASINKETIE